MVTMLHSKPYGRLQTFRGFFSIRNSCSLAVSATITQSSPIPTISMSCPTTSACQMDTIFSILERGVVCKSSLTPLKNLLDQGRGPGPPALPTTVVQ